MWSFFRAGGWWCSNQCAKFWVRALADVLGELPGRVRMRQASSWVTCMQPDYCFLSRHATTVTGRRIVRGSCGSRFRTTTTSSDIVVRNRKELSTFRSRKGASAKVCPDLLPTSIDILVHGGEDVYADEIDCAI
jgi:hypothetical protein